MTSAVFKRSYPISFLFQKFKTSSDNDEIHEEAAMCLFPNFFERTSISISVAQNLYATRRRTTAFWKAIDTLSNHELLFGNLRNG